MSTIDLVLKLLETGLSIWDQKLATKYMDKVVKLRKQHYEENKKPPGARNDAVIDNIRFELFNLADAFAAEVARSKAPN